MLRPLVEATPVHTHQRSKRRQNCRRRASRRRWARDSITSTYLPWIELRRSTSQIARIAETVAGKEEATQT